MRDLWIMKLQQDSDYAEWVARHEKNAIKAAATHAAHRGIGWLRINRDGKVEVIYEDAARSNGQEG